MNKNVDQASAFLSGLSNTHRLRILCLLIDGEKNVTQLIQATRMAQTSVSQHLRKLKEEKIVSFRREHRTLYYFISNQAAQEIMHILYQHYCQK
ncbi:MAG: helix-turn-helix transcriptional regulator [Alphaproteobacteria bacterium]|nr:helix-turn-helix transcriptional regulator [Alphaproteobacteria bacterium]